MNGVKGPQIRAAKPFVGAGLPAKRPVDRALILLAPALASPPLMGEAPIHFQAGGHCGFHRGRPRNGAAPHKEPQP